MEIKKLRGYQAATESTHGDGVNVWFNGDTYNIVNFDENSIDLDRIATSLSRICRYAGHTKISVAEHSYMMAYSFLLMGDVDKAFEAWGHDLVEAYIGDTVGPLKKLIPLKPIEEGIEYKLAKYFGYKWPHSEEVHIADKNSSQTEMTMMSMYGYRHTGTESMNIFTDSTIGWEPEYAKKKFIEMYELIRMLLSYKEDSHKEETTKQYQTKEQYHQAEPHKWYQHQIYHNFDEIYKEIRRKAETKGSFITERFDDNWIDRRMELLSCAQIRHSDNIKLHRIQAEKGHMLIDALREVILNDNWQAASDALEKLENWPIIKEDLQKNHANHINMVAEEYSLIHSIWVHGRTVVLAQKLLQGMLDEHNLELSRQLVDGNQKVDIKLHGELHVANVS